MIIFFDLDDTLYDRAEPFVNTFKECFQVFANNDKLAYDAFSSCLKRGDEMYLPSRRGEVSIEEMYIYRYKQGLFDVGVEISDEEALWVQEVYSKHQKHLSLSQDTARTLDYCRQNFDGIGIITNGPSDNQWNKIRTLGLEAWIDEKLIVVSGDVGIDKPDTRIFHIAEKLCDTKPVNLVYVGDSFGNDVIPSKTAGWHSVWLNKRNGSCQGDSVKPDFEIKSISELMGLHM